MKKKYFNRKRRIILGLSILILSLSIANAYIQPRFTGQVKWGEQVIAGATIEVECPGGQTANGLTDANGNYDVSVQWGYASHVSCYLKASHPNYQNGYATKSTAQPITNFNLNRIPLSLTVVTNNGVDATVEIKNVETTANGGDEDYPATSPVTCSGTGNNHVCSVYKGLGFELTINAPLHETRIYTDPDGVTNSGTLSLELFENSYTIALTLKPDGLTNPSVIITNGNGESCTYVQAQQWNCKVYKDQQFTITGNADGFDPNPYTTTYTSDYHPTAKTLTLTRTLLTIPVTVSSDGLNPLTGSTLSLTGGLGSCSDPNPTGDGVFSCLVYYNVPFTLTGNHANYGGETGQSFQYTRTGQESILLNLNPTTVTLSGTVTPINTQLNVDNGSGCTNNQGSYSCTVYKNQAFTMTGTAQYYTPGQWINTLSGDVSGFDISLARNTLDNVNVIINPQEASTQAIFSGDGLIDCTGSSGAYVCDLYEGQSFRIQATNPHYSPHDQEYTKIDTNDIVINLQQTTSEISGNLDPTTTLVEFMYAGSGYTPCAKDAGTYTCTVDSGEDVTVRATETGYITYTKNYPTAITDNDEHIILDPSLKISFDNDSPMTGNLLVDSPNDIYDQTIPMSPSLYQGDSVYLPLNPAGNQYTISYEDTQSRYEYQGTGKTISVNTATQSEVSLTIDETIWDMDMALVDANNNNNPIIDGQVFAEYDGIDHECPFSVPNQYYLCSIANNTPFNIRGEKDGYVTKYFFDQPQTITSQPGPGNTMDLQRNLRVGLMDDSQAAVNIGAIYINNSANTQTITTLDLTSNTEVEFYFAISPQTVNVYYVDGLEYSPSDIETITVTSTGQSLAVLGVEDTWPTIINVNSTSGVLTWGDYTLLIDENPPGDDRCQINNGVPTCSLNQYSHTIKVSKTGYTTDTVNVAAGNNGAAVNARINQTLRVNITDQNGNGASGTVKIINNSGVEIFSGSLSNGIVWAPIEPWQNNEKLTVEFSSSSYVDLEHEINAGNLNNQATHYVNLATYSQTSITVKLEDHYTHEELSDFEVRAWRDTTTYCTGNPCSFNMFEPPANVNLTISKDGYFEETRVDQEIGVGTLAMTIKPRAVIFMANEVNVTVNNTKKTSSVLDDEVLTTVSSNEDGTTSIPIGPDIEFMLFITAKNYKNMTLGPFNTYNDVGNVTLIASENDPIEMDLLYGGVLEPPIITGMSYSPQYPNATDNITVTINVSDDGRGKHNITQCQYRIDQSLQWFAMDSAYNNYTLNATKNIGQLSNGNHTIDFSCEDTDDGWSTDRYYIEVLIGEEARGQQDDDQDQDDDSDDDSDDDQDDVPTSNALRLAELRSKYELIIKSGFNTATISAAIQNAEDKIGTSEASQALTDAENAIPLITLKGGGTVRTTKNSSPETIALEIAQAENQPYTANQLRNTLKTVAFSKTARRYTLEGEDKTIITLKVFSRESNPDAVIADFNPGQSSAPTTITTNQGSITYFKGLSQGENVFEYVVTGEVTESSEPIVFEMKSLSGAEGITGFSIGIPGLLEIPVIYVGIGAAILLLVIKFLI